MSDCRFLQRVLNMYLQRCLVVTWLVPRETAAISTQSVYTIQPCSMSRHFTQSQLRRVHACLAVTCHLHFWQNDRECLRATAVTRCWKGYRIRAQQVNPGEEKSPAAPAGTQTRDLSVTSPAF